MHEVVAALFEEKFGRPPFVVVKAPGRVNLIGDHTDYNDGFVLPMALNLAVWMAAAPRRDREVRVFSSELGEGRFDLDRLRRQSSFVDYLSGVTWAIGPDQLPGLDIAISSDLPVGAGLSSSAAVEMATLLLFSELGDREWDPKAAAVTARQVENEWMGVGSGIMDPLIVGIARAGYATMIDCRSLDTHALPIPPAVEVVVLDSGTRRQLTNSVYNERREACERAAAALGVGKLREANIDLLEGVRLDPLDRRRARHVITENDRVLATAAAVERGDLSRVGELMNQSHKSLKQDYEVSTPALDSLVAVARARQGCVGARLTGAGMGGCAVALVWAHSIGEFLESVPAIYECDSGLPARLYPSSPMSGAEVVWQARPRRP